MNSNTTSPHQTVEDRPALQRSSSTSSSDSAESSHTRSRKAIRSPRRRTSASGVQAVEDEQSGSRRGSISSMRTSSAPLEGPVTYTPTTHRISKAKKGKRVHACEYGGCNKVYGFYDIFVIYRSNDGDRSSLAQNTEGAMSSTILQCQNIIVIAQDATKSSTDQICCNVIRIGMSLKLKQRAESSATGDFQVTNLRLQSPTLSSHQHQ